MRITKNLFYNQNKHFTTSLASSIHASVSEITVGMSEDACAFGKLVSSGDSYSDNESFNISCISSENIIEDSQTSDLLPPPPASFSSYELLQEEIPAWTKDQGYDLVVSRFYKHNSKIVRRSLECGRAGKSQNKRNLSDNDRIRKISTNKIGCRMGIYAVADDRENPEGSWSIRHKASDQSKIQSHGPEIGIANQRRYERVDVILSEIQKHVEAGITTAQTISVLRMGFPNLKQTKHDIRNIKYRFRKEILKSMGPTKALLSHLDKNSFLSRPTVDGENHLHPLFLAHPKSILLLKIFHDIVLLDCTYKTNRHNKPLLNICGVTGLNKTIQIALCFMAIEKTESNFWALQQFSQLLHQEHIELLKLFVTDRNGALINALDLIFPNI